MRSITHSEIDHKWAVIRLSDIQNEEQKRKLEDTMRTEATEFLKSSPKVKQLCVFERNG